MDIFLLIQYLLVAQSTSRVCDVISTLICDLPRGSNGGTEICIHFEVAARVVGEKTALAVGVINW